MLAYHFLYDVTVVYGREPTWYLRPGVHLWQRYICWSFILIAGFSYHWGGRPLRRGVLLNVWGLVITAVTLAAVPSEAIWFGILSFLGCAVLLTAALEKGLEKMPPALGLAVCFGLLVLLLPVNTGFVGLGAWRVRLPEALYRFRVLAPLGFPDAAFASSDYFPLLPWYPLFLCGWFLGKLFRRPGPWQERARTKVPLLSFVGRHTLPVYLLHQPLLMGLCMLIFQQ